MATKKTIAKQAKAKDLSVGKKKGAGVKGGATKNKAPKEILIVGSK